ncbi:MAG: efflux RND transporter periplasmic adaptor subunit [Phycisphaerales bacterium]|nr:efflux RND transporter periplasmic adaptor subunit [Phycisphaerales bacterium]
MKNAHSWFLAAAAAGMSIVALPASVRATILAQPEVQPPSSAQARARWQEVSREFGGVASDTRPSRDAVMRFSTPTEVREVSVMGGQQVKKGELLIRARDAEISAAIEQQKVVASSNLELLGSEASRDLAKFRYDRLIESKEHSPAEAEERRIELATATIQVEVAKMRSQVENLRLKAYEAQSERFRLDAPFDGVVEEVLVEVGQGVNEQAPAIRIVNIDRLWLDPTPDTYDTIRLSLKEGSPAWVLVDLVTGPRLVEGKVLYLSPVADSVSQSRRVRVEIENPDYWPAGTQAMVRFDRPDEKWMTPTGAAGTRAEAAGARAAVTVRGASK